RERRTEVIAAAAFVEIVRDTPEDVQDRWVRVSVDGGPEQILRYGQTLRLTLLPGRHRVRAHNTLSSDVVEFSVRDGQTLWRRCHYRLYEGGMLSCVAIGLAYITVRLEILEG